MSTAVVVTGATGGLGSEIVVECSAKADADWAGLIFGVCRDRDKFDAKGLSVQCQCFVHDALNPFSNYSCLIELIDKFNPHGIVCIHTAFSIAPIIGIGNMSEDQIVDNIQCNVTDTVKLINSLASYSRITHTAIRFINMDSGAARHPIRGWSLYCSAKAYVNMLLRCCACDSPTFSYISYDPGVVDTIMQREIRNAPGHDFPDLALFKAYKAEGMLHDPRMVAKDIVERFVMRPALKNKIEKYQP